MATNPPRETSDFELPIFDQGGGIKTTSCFGRKIKTCHFCSSTTLFTISLLAGTILLGCGAAALGAHYYASSTTGTLSTILTKIHSLSTQVADRLGSDVLQISIFTTAFGAAFSGTGLAGLMANLCFQPARVRDPADDLPLMT